MGWALREGWVDQNPVVATHRAEEPTPRSRVLSDAELSDIWAACLQDDYGRIIKLLLLTGARRNEVGDMAFSELNGTIWRVPPARTKNDRELVLDLPSLAVEIIRSVTPRKGRDFLFGSGAGGFSGWSKAKAALNDRILNSRQKLDGPAAKPMLLWHQHDLRRTVATRMADLKVKPHVIEQLLNHVSGHKAGVAGIYNWSTSSEEVKAALALWADHIAGLVGLQKAAG